MWPVCGIKDKKIYILFIRTNYFKERILMNVSRLGLIETFMLLVFMASLRHSVLAESEATFIM